MRAPKGAEIYQCFLLIGINGCRNGLEMVGLRSLAVLYHAEMHTMLATCRSGNGSEAAQDVMDSLRSNVEQHKASIKWARAIIVENK